MADEAVAKQQCKTLVKIIVIMKMMMITIDIIIMVVRNTDTLERFSPLVIITCHEEKESFCI